MYGTLISSVTVGSGGAASIDFTSIPGTYTDLILVLSLRGSYSTTYGLDNIYITTNSSITNINAKRLYGNGASASSEGWTNYFAAGYINGSGTTANTFSNNQIYFPNYSGTTNKTFSHDGVSETNATNTYQELIAGVINTTSAITSLKLTQNAGTFVQYSTAYLYGLTKGSGGATVS